MPSVGIHYQSLLLLEFYRSLQTLTLTDAKWYHVLEVDQPYFSDVFPHIVTGRPMANFYNIPSSFYGSVYHNNFFCRAMKSEIAPGWNMKGWCERLD